MLCCIGDGIDVVIFVSSYMWFWFVFVFGFVVLLEYLLLGVDIDWFCFDLVVCVELWKCYWLGEWFMVVCLLWLVLCKG